MQEPSGSPGPPRRFPWRTLFSATGDGVFVLGPSHRIRYVNLAWERLTGRALSQVRGTRVAAGRRSTAPFWQSLAPPAECWRGQVAQVRRAPPTSESGPPWWDITFVPLPTDRPGAFNLLGFVKVVGDTSARPPRKISAGMADCRHRHASHFTLDLLTGKSLASERLLAQAHLAAQSLAPVGIVGEAGTGKETLARIIHHQGTQREKPFCAIDCRGLQPYLIEGQLFGKGGLAWGGHLGTLYLKEPSALPRDLQNRIASLFVAPKPITPRLIWGSARSAADDLTTGTLVPTFHTRLSMLTIEIPPLRRRTEDLPRFIDHWSDRVEPGRAGPLFAEDVWPVLLEHDWPGNLRELFTVLEESRSSAGVTLPIGRDHLPRWLREKTLAPLRVTGPMPRSLDQMLEEVERRLIEVSLRNHAGSVGDAAEALGVTRARLARRIEALGIDAARTRRRLDGTPE